MNKICHLTSVHHRSDTRIFLKYCTSLACAGFDVTLIVADGFGDEVKKGVRIIDVKKSPNRIRRMLFATTRVLMRALFANAKIYHFHDPELIPCGLILRLCGRKVIFDIHEDISRQLLSKTYISHTIKPVISHFFGRLENIVVKYFSAVCVATPSAKKRISKKSGLRVELINNYPISDELLSGYVTKECGGRSICYLGGISRQRGIIELVKSLSLLSPPVTLHLIGNFSDSYDVVKKQDGWRYVKFHGFLGREAVARVLSLCSAGIITFHPLPNHIEAQPNKLFEYISAGLPVICSKFPNWQRIIDLNHCGVVVNPLSINDIAKGIHYVLDREMFHEKEHFVAMSKKYSWESQFQKVLKLYKAL